MGSYDPSDLRGQVTWRHEYGHHIDGDPKSGTLYWSSTPKFESAMQADADRLVKGSGHGRSSKATAARKADLAQAYRQAESDMLSAWNPEVWLRQRFSQQGIDFDAALASLQQHTVFANQLQGDALFARLARICQAFEEVDAQGLMDALLGKGNGPEAVIGLNAKGVCRSLSDLIGSATRNKVCGFQLSGYGHTDSYYRKFTPSAGTECFANLTSLYGDGGLFWKQVVEEFTPEMSRAFLEIMKP